MPDYKPNKNPYSSLEHAIETTVQAIADALDGAAKHVTPPKSETQSGAYHYKYRAPERPVSAAPAKKPKLKRRGMGIVPSAIIAWGLLFPFGSFLQTYALEGDAASLVMALVFALGAAGVLLNGVRNNVLFRSAGRYLGVIGNAPEYSIASLAQIVNKPMKRIRNELERLIDKGYFGKQAFVDYAGNRIVIDPDRAAILRRAQAAEEPAAKQPEEPSAQPADEYTVWLEKIMEANLKIEDQPVTLCINRIYLYTEKIFAFVREHPESAGQIRTFMNYYLPMTLKLLQSYDMIEEAGVAGENMRTTKESIEGTLDMLADAYRHQLDQLYESEAMDISTDIDVLEQMLRRDGLDGQNDFSAGTATAAAEDTEEE